MATLASKASLFAVSLNHISQRLCRKLFFSRRLGPYMVVFVPKAVFIPFLAQVLVLGLRDSEAWAVKYHDV